MTFECYWLSCVSETVTLIVIDGYGKLYISIGEEWTSVKAGLRSGAYVG